MFVCCLLRFRDVAYAYYALFEAPFAAPLYMRHGAEAYLLLLFATDAAIIDAPYRRHTPPCAIYATMP